MAPEQGYPKGEVYPGWYGRGIPRVVWERGIPGYIHPMYYPGIPPYIHPVPPWVYHHTTCTCHTLHATARCCALPDDGALGSKRRKPMGESLPGG